RKRGEGDDRCYPFFGRGTRSRMHAELSARSLYEKSTMGTQARYAMPRKVAGILLILGGIIGCGMAPANAASSGTGFAVGNGNSALTNFHVVDGCKSVRIANVGAGQIKILDRRNDIAVIQPYRPITGALR